MADMPPIKYRILFSPCEAMKYKKAEPKAAAKPASINTIPTTMFPKFISYDLKSGKCLSIASGLTDLIVVGTAFIKGNITAIGNRACFGFSRIEGPATATRTISLRSVMKNDSF